MLLEMPIHDIQQDKIDVAKRWKDYDNLQGQKTSPKKNKKIQKDERNMADWNLLPYKPI